LQKEFLLFDLFHFYHPLKTLIHTNNGLNPEALMGTELNDIERIRTARILCIQHRFAEALDIARKVEDPKTRETLLFICKSFQTSQIRVHAA
jgi:hypothetical protein